MCNAPVHVMGKNSLLGYIEASSYYLNTINIETIKKLAATVVLLDYDTNENIEDSTKPLSHAALIKKYIEYCPKN